MRNKLLFITMLFASTPNYALTNNAQVGGIDKDLAVSLTQFGLMFTVGTFNLIRDSSKPPVPPQTAEEIGAQATGPDIFESYWVGISLLRNSMYLWWITFPDFRAYRCVEV